MSGLTISRSAHDADNPFTQIANTALRNKQLSLDTRGLLALMLSHSDGYVVNEETLRAEGAGRSQARRMIRELEAAGYLNRKPKMKDKQGKWTAARWELAEEPTAQKRTSVKRTSEKPTAGEPTSDNGPSLRITIPKEQQEKQEEQSEEQQRALRESGGGGGGDTKTSRTAYELYAAEIGELTQMIGEQLADLIKEYGELRVIDAIRIAVEASVRTMRFIKGVLRRTSAQPKNDLRLRESEAAPVDGPQFIPPPDVDEEIAPAGIEVVEPPAVRWLDRDPVEPKNDFRVVHEARWPRSASELKAVGD